MGAILARAKQRYNLIVSLLNFTRMKIINAQLRTKKNLRIACLEVQQRLADTAKTAMQQAQESANGEKGTMEDRFESFREQCQINRDMYAKQWQELLSGLLVLQKMDVSRKNDAVTLGSVVVTDTQAFFISISIGEVKLKGKAYFAISTSSPLFKAMAGKRQGDRFPFRDKIHQIVDVY
jgi:transcription elongation GreA/GreB family factor